MKITLLAALTAIGVLAAAPAGGQQGQGQGAMLQPDAQTTRQIQQKLNEQGFDAGSTDGEWGPQTRQAVQKFQEQKGLPATGQLDPQTLSALGIDPSVLGQQGGQPQGEQPQGGQQQGGQQ